MATARYWKSFLWEQLQKNIEKQGLTSTYMSLATVSTQQNGQPPLPRVRTVVFRSFAGEHHTDELGWTSDWLVVTTDARSRKLKEIADNRNYEVSWYMNGTGEQFRLRGDVFVYPADGDDVMPPVKTSGRLVSSSIKKHGNQAFIQRQAGQQSFDWEAERRRHFGLLDDGLRATFSSKKPPPRQLTITGLDGDGWYTSPDQDDLNAAYENFCLLVLTVDQMDYISLAGDHELFYAKM
ncbi:pyridoxamine 5'-phosphate oxidase-domain-containing protein [Chlamydoabsidia padenii]|nr:pyridoxamine 5'-phosphate oxidase-domain-containing protein [Chlamydoabsidia padenii]